MKTLNTAARIVATIALAVMLATAGLFACCARPTALLLAQAASNAADSPYDKEALVGLAVLTRDHTVDGADRTATLDTIAQAASDVSPAVAQSADKVTALEALGERYTLTDDALDHLDDVHRVLVGARWALAATAAACIAAAAHVYARCGRKEFGTVLRNAAIATITVFAARVFRGLPFAVFRRRNLDVFMGFAAHLHVSPRILAGDGRRLAGRHGCGLRRLLYHGEVDAQTLLVASRATEHRFAIV